MATNLEPKTSAGCRALLEQLEAKRAALAGRLEAIEAERGQLSLKAGLGDAESTKRLAGFDIEEAALVREKRAGEAAIEHVKDLRGRLLEREAATDRAARLRQWPAKRQVAVDAAAEFDALLAAAFVAKGKRDAAIRELLDLRVDAIAEEHIASHLAYDAHVLGAILEGGARRFFPTLQFQPGEPLAKVDAAVLALTNAVAGELNRLGPPAPDVA
jgi:hypothetical protein